MIKRNYLVVVLVFALINVFAQESINAEKELIITLPLGSKQGMISYASSEEGFYGPGAPSLDDKGSLWFFSVTNKFILKVHNKKVETIEYPVTYPKEYRGFGLLCG